VAFKPKRFDGAVFSRMVEPLMVRVERTVGASRPTPIELPPKEGAAPGMGWLKDDILKLEAWLVRSWTGGGVYEVSVVDDAGTKLDWTFSYDTKQYPPRNPPTLPGVDSAPSSDDTTTQQATAQAVVTGEANWPPPASDYSSVISPQPAPQPVARPAPQPQQVRTAMIPPTQYVAAPVAPTAPNNDFERRALQEQLAFAREQISKIERERVEAQHQADLERIRQDNDRKFEELKRSLTPKDDSRIDKLEALILKVLDKPAPAPVQLGPDPSIIAMQEETRRMREEMQRAEAARREEQTRAEAARREETQRATERADQQRREDQHARELSEMRMQIAAANAKPSGPDPMMLLMVDMVKDIARSSQSQIDNLKGFMMTPKDIAAMNKESSGAVDDVRRTLMGSFNDLFGMQRQVVENMMAMQPQGESTLDKAIDAAKGMADRYMGGQRDVAVSTAKAQAESSKAQAEMAHAQRAHLEILAQREAEARAADAASTGGLNGHTNGDARAHGGAVNDGTNGVAGQPELVAEVPVGTAPVIEVVDATTQPAAPTNYGKTDAQWFTDALPHVGQLRDGVALYFKSIHATPPNIDAEGKPLGIDADQAAKNILQAVATIVTNKLHIPAFNDLFLAQKYTEFMEVLLPGTPSRYRADVMGAIIAEMNGVNDGDEDDDQPEDDAE